MRKPVRLLILALSFICTGTQAFPGTGDPAGADDHSSKSGTKKQYPNHLNGLESSHRWYALSVLIRAKVLVLKSYTYENLAHKGRGNFRFVSSRPR